MSTEPFKTHGCGAVYPTRAEWDALPFGGEQITADETGTYRLEMRHCPCGSTLGIEERIGGAHCENCNGPCAYETAAHPIKAPPFGVDFPTPEITPEEIATENRLWEERHLKEEDRDDGDLE